MTDQLNPIVTNQHGHRFKVRGVTCEDSADGPVWCVEMREIRTVQGFDRTADESFWIPMTAFVQRFTVEGEQ